MWYARLLRRVSSTITARDPKPGGTYGKSQNKAAQNVAGEMDIQIHARERNEHGKRDCYRAKLSICCGKNDGANNGSHGMA